MRFLHLLPILIVVFCSINGQEISTSDLFQKFLDVEQQIKEQWANDYQVYRQKQQEAQEKFKQVINAVSDSFKQKAQEVKDVVNKIKQAKEQQEAEKEQQRQDVIGEIKKAFEAIAIARNATKEKEKQQVTDLLNKIKEKWDQKTQEAAEEKKQEIENLKTAIQQWRERWNNWVAEIDAAKQDAWNKQKERLEKAKKDFDDLKATIEQEKNRREEAKQQRKDQLKQQLDQYQTDIQTKKDELDTLESEVVEKLQTIQAKRREIAGLMQQALNDQAKAAISEKLYKKVQENLDKAAIKELSKQQKNEATGAVPAAKATVLDEITGTSQWQTVTWILLALSILLAVALIALIMFQIAQRRHYQQLEGHNNSERTPLTSHPEGLTYSDVGTSAPKKSILSTPKVGTSRMTAVPVEEDPTAPSEEPVI